MWLDGRILGSWTVRLAPATLLLSRCSCEAPQGAVPSAGALHFYADYELRLSPEQLGMAPLQWQLPAWHFQHELSVFYGARAACAGQKQCPAPPLNTALFVLSLPAPVHQQLMDECPGLFLASLLLVAEARLHTDPSAAGRLFEQALRLQANTPAPGWGLELAAGWYERTNRSVLRRQSYPADCASRDLDLVVAHCSEDLGWLAGIPPARVWVYEKCGPTAFALPPCTTTVPLPNLAMESLAYATHMQRQHGDFARFTVFLQGSPYEHAPRMLLDSVLQSLRSGTYDVPFLHLNARRFLSGANFCLRDLHARLFGAGAAPDAFGSYCCNQFVVRRDRLEARPQHLYARIVQLLLGQLPLACAQDVSYDARPRIAVSALFEHLWHVVLGEDPILPPRHSDGRLPLFARLDSVPGGLPDQLHPGDGPGA